MLIYSLHRIVGIRKVAESRLENRFALIRKYRSHLIIYASIASLISAYCVWNFDWSTRLLLLFPAGISILYVLPILLNNNRLRDVSYIKIFLVALSWALLCGAIPLQMNGIDGMDLYLFIAEKACFIFAITLPFDFRDYKVDQEAGVRTLAHVFGDKIKFATMASFAAAIVLMMLSGLYTDSQKIILFMAYLMIETITRYAMNRKHDYYYSGVIDGTMILFYICTLFSDNIEGYLGL